MQAFLAFLSIALVAQVSFVASTHRSRRESLSIYQAVKEVVAEQTTIVAAVLKDIPNTANYSSFKKYWEDYTNSYNQTNENLLCSEKREALLAEFAAAISSYKAFDAPAEAKEMLGLFERHGLEQHVQSVTAKFKTVKFSHTSESEETC